MGCPEMTVLQQNHRHDLPALVTRPAQRATEFGRGTTKRWSHASDDRTFEIRRLRASISAIDHPV